jgi:hypothetical protein
MTEPPRYRRYSRFIVAATFVGGAAIFGWQWQTRAIETPVAIVLTDVAVPVGGGLLRYEHVVSVTADFRDKTGASLARMSARGGQAVLAPPPVALPAGEYTVDVSLALVGPGGERVTQRLMRSLKLDGSMTELRL